MTRLFLCVALSLVFLPACGDDDNPSEKPVSPRIGLVSEYLLDGNALDTAGSNDGTLVGGPVPASDRFGRLGHALVFDGVGDCVETPEDDFANGNDVSISFWFKVPSTSSSANNVIVSSDFTVFLDGDEAGLSTTTDLYSCMQSSVFGAANTWHHFLGTYDGNNLTLYIDGQLAGANNCPGVIEDTNRPLSLACFGATHWNGSLDDVRIYNRSISNPAEISDLYHEGGYGL